MLVRALTQTRMSAVRSAATGFTTIGQKEVTNGGRQINFDVQVYMIIKTEQKSEEEQSIFITLLLFFAFCYFSFFFLPSSIYDT